MGTDTKQEKTLGAFLKADGSYKICNDDDCDDCPTVTSVSLGKSDEGDMFSVRDDDGGVVHLTRAQLREVGKVADMSRSRRVDLDTDRAPSGSYSPPSSLVPNDPSTILR